MATPKNKLEGPPPGSRDPLPRDEVAWAAISKLVEELYPVPQTLTGELARVFLPIEHDYVFEPRDSDKDFRFQHVESLVDQAADLLDRCLRARGEYLELSGKAFNQALEIQEYQRIHPIHEQEIKAGFYDFPYLITESLARAQTVTAGILNQTLVGLESLLQNQYSSQAMSEFVKMMLDAGRFGVLPAYAKDTPNPENKTERQEQVKYDGEYKSFWAGTAARMQAERAERAGKQHSLLR